MQIVTRLFRPVLLVTVAVAVVNFFRHIHLLSVVRTSCVYKLLVKVFRCTFVVGIVLEPTSYRNFAEHRKKVWGLVVTYCSWYKQLLYSSLSESVQCLFCCFHEAIFCNTFCKKRNSGHIDTP